MIERIARSKIHKRSESLASEKTVPRSPLCLAVLVEKVPEVE